MQAAAAALPDGERRLTNLLHLAELAAPGRRRRTTSGLTGLLTLARPAARPVDAAARRNTSCGSKAMSARSRSSPSTRARGWNTRWCSARSPGPVPAPAEATIFFHDPAADDRLTARPQRRRDSRQPRTALEREMLSENLRLLYVAVTRAKERCYLAWGRINTAETSALAYLLHWRGCRSGAPTADWISRA
ncbi:MAG: hypothetical protein MZV70_67730 [Desulfobacterales bacterium]|nr:hypothetical protein [Desulfobacterales bacterium]